MKKIIILAVGIILSVGSVVAQQPRRGGGRQFSTKERVERLKKELDLNDEQTDKVTVLYDEFQKKMNATENRDREQMRNEMEKLNKSIDSLLTKDQQKAFKKLQSNDRNRQRGGGQRGGFGGGRR